LGQRVIQILDVQDTGFILLAGILLPETLSRGWIDNRFVELLKLPSPGSERRVVGDDDLDSFPAIPQKSKKKNVLFFRIGPPILAPKSLYTRKGVR